jgi:hypothetical protein
MKQMSVSGRRFIAPSFHVWGRLPALVCFAALLLTTAGGFDTETLAPLPRLGYWVAVSMISVSALELCHVTLQRRLGWTQASLRILGYGLLLLPLTVVAMIGCKLLFGGAPTVSGLRHLLPGMITILAALQVLLLLFTAPPPHPAQSTSPQSELVDRLPLPLRSAKLYALEAEDHYVRVHTSAGQTLIRMRFSDAVAAVSHEEGLRPHRSWWVASQGVVAFKRERGRQILELANGTAVPVSRSAARELGPSF